jgi:hypothetical protein
MPKLTRFRFLRLRAGLAAGALYDPAFAAQMSLRQTGCSQPSTCRCRPAAEQQFEKRSHR